MAHARPYVHAMTTHRPPILSFLLALVLLVAVAASAASSAGADICNGVCLQPSHLGFRGSGRVSFEIEGAFTMRVATGSLDAQARRGSTISVSGSVFPLYTEVASGDPGSVVSRSGELVFAKQMSIRGFCPTACKVDVVAAKLAGMLDGAARYTFYGSGGWSDSFGHTGLFCPLWESQENCERVLGDAGNSADFFRLTDRVGSWVGASQPILPRTRNRTYFIDQTTLDVATALRRLYAVVGDGATPPLPKP